MTRDWKVVVRRVKGMHDVRVVPRAVPMVESVVALVLVTTCSRTTRRASSCRVMVLLVWTAKSSSSSRERDEGW